MAATGKLIDVQTALQIGYANYRSAEPMKTAVEMANRIAKKPGPGVSQTRKYFNHRLLQAMNAADDMFMDNFLDTWYSPTGQACIQAQAQRLSGKK